MPSNVFIDSGDGKEEAPGDGEPPSDDLEYHNGEPGAPGVAVEEHHHSESRVEGVAMMETSLGPVLEADGIEELPSCVRVAQGAVPGSASQLYALEEEMKLQRSTAQRKLQKEQHSKVDMNKINDGTVLPVTASQVLLARPPPTCKR